MTHEEKIKQILSEYTDVGTLKSRESNTVEFKEGFNKNSTAKYARTMAAFANNRGGYILFGIKDRPRIICGLSNNNFDNLNQEQLTASINSLFSPAIEWECGICEVMAREENRKRFRTKKVGWIYVEESIQKPVIAQKDNSGEKISSGDIYYRYRAQSKKIQYAEMTRLIEERISREREGLLKLFEAIRKNGTANLGIVNYSNGSVTTPYGVDVAFDRRLITQVLKKARFIKEGSFNETAGIPVIKVTGNIDLAEEVPVPEGNPDQTHPFIQRQLAEMLGISKQDVYAMIWYFKMKGQRRYHLEITTSGSGKTHKFSEHAFRFLKEKWKALNASGEIEKARELYRNRNK